MNYLSRTADILLQEKLDAFGAVLIEGPKWSGKTTTAKQQAKSVLEMQDPDSRNGYLATAATKPSLLLAGDTSQRERKTKKETLDWLMIVPPRGISH